MFIERVNKFNDFNWRQQRIIVITTDSILNIKSKKVLRRKIQIKDLSGITINLQKANEIVIHVNNEIDIRMLTTSRKKIIDILKVLYLNSTKNKNENLPIYGVEQNSLQQFQKTTSDLKKGILSKEPNDLTRLEEEDLVKMNLDDAICGLSDSEEDDPSSGIEISNSSGTMVQIEEESKFSHLDRRKMQPIVSQSCDINEIYNEIK